MTGYSQSATVRLQFSSRECFQLAVILLAALGDGAATPVLTILLSKIFNSMGLYVSHQASGEYFMSSVIESIAGILSIGLTVIILSWITVTLSYLVAGAQVSRIRRLVFSSLVHKPIQWFDSTQGSVGLLTVATKNIDDMFLALFSCSMVIQALSSILGCFILSIYMSWKLTLISLIGLPLMIIIGVLTFKPLQRNTERAREASAQSASLIHWALSCTDTVHLFNNEKFEVTKIETKLRNVRRFYLQCSKWLNFQVALTRVILLAMFIQSFYYGAKLVKQGLTTPGNVVLVFWCCLSINQTLHGILPYLESIQKGKIAMKNISEFCDPGADTYAHFKSTIGLYPERSRGNISLFNVCSFKMNILHIYL